MMPKRYFEHRRSSRRGKGTPAAPYLRMNRKKAILMQLRTGLMTTFSLAPPADHLSSPWNGSSGT